jgi:hypothetical protein
MFRFILGILFLTNSLFLTPSSSIDNNLINSKEPKLDETSYGKEYFPVEIKKKMIYNSNFGELELKVTKEKNIYLFNLDSEKFKYKQKIFVTDDGYYVNETYQKIKLLLFITKEGNYVYDKPLLRVPLPVKIGDEWTWQGKEYIDDETHSVNVKGKASSFESVTTPSGKYDAIKIESTLETSKGTKNVLTEWYVKDLGMVKMKVEIKGGGMLGFARDVLGYGELVFELKEIKDK